MDAMVLCAHSLLGHHGWKMMRLLPRRRLCSAAAVSQPLAGTSSATVAGNKLARDTKRVLRRLPSPVVVVTTKGKDGTLRATQVNISNHFSKGAPADKSSLAQFRDLSYHSDPETDMPVLHGTLGVIFCTKREALEMGDHMVWFGNVVSVQEGAPGNPLLYYARTYRHVGEEAFMAKFESAELAFDKWTHVAHVRMGWNYIQAYGSLEDALPHIREGINRYNHANADKIKHNYNETITNFYAFMIAQALAADKFAGIDTAESTFPEFLHRHGELANKALIRNYYTDDLLHSQAARAQFVPPDKQPLPAAPSAPI